MRVPVMRANFVGNKSNLNDAISILKSTGAFHMTHYKKGLRHEEAVNQDKYEKFGAIKRRLEHAINLAKVRPTKTEIEPDDLKAFAGYEHNALEIVKELEDTEREINQIDQKITQNRETIRGLREYYGLPVPFSTFENTQYVVNYCGIMPTLKLELFLRDVNTENMNVETYPYGKYKKIVILTAHKDDAPVAEVIFSYDFEPCKYKFTLNAVDTVKNLTAEIANLKVEREQSVSAYKLAPQEEITLKSYFDFVTGELDTMDLTADTLQTQKYFVISGWITAGAQSKIQKLLKKSMPDIHTEFRKPHKDDDAPVVLRNNPIVTPFRNITNMYGEPAARDIDPNPWVALFYFLFFGLMIGDVGYGVVLACAIGAFIFFKKPNTGTRNFLLLFGICSISSIIWGVIFGSFFGFGMGTRVIDPLDGAIYVLLIALAMGVLQLTVGIMLNLYVMIKNGEYLRAAIKGVPRVILFMGLILFLPKFGMQLFDLTPPAFFMTVAPVGMWIAIVGAISTAISNPYTLISYFNDTISYVRLFALSLVGTVIATIGNTMGGMLFGIPVIGWFLGIAIAVAFHVFNLGLGLLGAYIHGARLQFIEFFSKFYAGNGSAFRPIGGNLRYTYLKEVN